MTAGPLTLEDLERIEARVVGVGSPDGIRLCAALRSVIAERDALAKWRAEARREWERFLRAPTDAESDEGSKALDRLMEATRLAGGKPIDQ